MNWNQLRTILWLRCRLTWNQWSRGGGLNAALTLIAVVVGLGIALGGCIGGALAGALSLAKGPPQVLLLVWDALVGIFLFVWAMGILAEIQRSETIDLSRLLHLPVSLKEIFLVNYLASHLTLSLILFVPGMLGLSAGLMLGKGWLMALLFPLVLSLIFMVTAWTYCLRGWLIALMVNQRRRRAILVGVTMGVMLLSQLPNLYFNVFLDPSRPQPVPREVRAQGHKARDGNMVLPVGFLAAHKLVPPMWVGGGALSLATGNAWPAIWGSLGGLVIGALGLMRAYRSTVRFYHGGGHPKLGKPSRPTQVSQGVRKAFLERRLPIVPEECAALSLAFFRSLTRAPEVKMALGTNFMMLVIFAVMFVSRSWRTLDERAKPFVAAGAVAVAFFGMLQFMFNQFGFDRDGFRALVLLPTRRRHILFAKNLSFLPVAAAIGLIFLTVITFTLSVPVSVLLAACCQLVATFLLISMAGNFMSVIAPYRIAPGSLKPTKASTRTTFLIFFSHLFFPVVMVPVFLPPVLGFLSGSVGWLPAATVNLLLSLVLLALVGLGYWLSLEGLGRLLQRREREILQAVTQEVE